jgi:hypothetical protein
MQALKIIGFLGREKCMVVEYRPWTWKIPENSAGMKGRITRQDAQERRSDNSNFHF